MPRAKMAEVLLLTCLSRICAFKFGTACSNVTFETGFIMSGFIQHLEL